MYGLRPEQHELLRRHREEAFELLLVASAAYTGATPLRDLPEGTALLREPPERLVPVAVSAAAAAVERRRLQQEAADKDREVGLEAADSFPIEVLDALRRRRLPFTGEDVELLLDLGTTSMRPDRILGREPGSPPVFAALGRAGPVLDVLKLSNNGGPLRRRIRALVSEQSPGGLLDLSVLETGDAWAEPAKKALRRHAAGWDDTQQLVALLSRATGTRPTKAWRRLSAELAASYGGYGTLMRELLEPLLSLELVPSGAPWPPAWLVAPPNEPFVRGAAWATVDVREPWVVGLLGRLALRGAAP